MNTNRLRDKHEHTWRSLGDVHVGGVTLSNPLMLASGTAGHGVELAPYMPLQSLGAVVVKSLYHEPWPGNRAPRVHLAASGMVNAVGLQGPGVLHWLEHDAPRLHAHDVTVVASIWGRSVDDYAKAAAMLADAPDNVVAVEVNLSCPNLEGRSSIFAHDGELSAQVIQASLVCGRPVWAKLSANTDRIVDIAGAVSQAGASAVTLINTMLGMQITSNGRPSLGNGGGGLSGPAIHPIAVRAVYDVSAAHPMLDIIGVGGVASDVDVIEMMMAGAKAVQVGTATFADPRAAYKMLHRSARRLMRQGVTRWADIVALAHRH
jgi:dihydroorotate dehydrogenase (NAD+) catalytic subunit